MTLLELAIFILFILPTLLYILLVLAKWRESYLWDVLDEESKNDPQR